jgi:hypothetical protein
MTPGPFNDGEKFAQDLSFMTDADWKRLNDANRERLSRRRGRTDSRRGPTGRNTECLGSR